ncbi:endonuclease [Gangjinia marincola]|uniref:Endonuclease n=1 Tax=Gangjinia marincola TaxID=578463 RepID=A0ABN1MIC3_9FLAO
MLSLLKKQDHVKNAFTIAFYNLENLFDTNNDPYALDDDFTPDSQRNWNKKRYYRKLRKLASVISQIGETETGHSPDVIGVAEVENKTVLEDLCKERALEKLAYGVIHFDSPDERGIDVGLLYKKETVQIISSETIPLMIESTEGVRDLTRDILYVHLALAGEELHLLVNHWPSRREGATSTEYKRLAAAEANLHKIEEIKQHFHHPTILVMGDFNDNPESRSLKTLEYAGLKNLTKSLKERQRGTQNYEFQWNLFDQILISKPLENKSRLTYLDADIFDPLFLKIHRGKFKGNPFRTYVGRKYKGGYSDHFPVYLILQCEK